MISRCFLKEEYNVQRLVQALQINDFDLEDRERSGAPKKNKKETQF